MPRVSIISALYNKGDYVASMIASVLAQSFQDWELIVVDNGSSDAGPEWAREAAGSDSRIRLITYDAVRGPGAARNCGLSHASGEWVLFLDADDLIAHDHLDCLLAASARFPEANIITSDWQEFTITPDHDTVRKRAAGTQGDRAALLNYAVAFAPWAIHTTLVRRRVISEDLVWPQALDREPGEDIHFWFRLVRVNPVAYANSAGALYRIETPGGRNTKPGIERWFAGVTHAAEANVSHLRDKGEEPSAGQAASLLRLYEGMHREALASNNQTITRAAEMRARYWLDRTPPSSLPLLLRKWVGIRLYQRLASICRRYRSRPTPPGSQR